MNKKDIVEAISLLVEIECTKKKTNKTQLSLKLGKNSRYLHNMFNKNDSIGMTIICEIALLLDCEPKALIPNLDFLKTLN